MEDIENITLIRETENETEVSIQQKNDADVREELFYKLAECHLPIMNLSVDTKSLEDIFLQLTEIEKEEEKTDVSDL